MPYLSNGCGDCVNYCISNSIPAQWLKLFLTAPIVLVICDDDEAGKTCSQRICQLSPLFKDFSVFESDIGDLNDHYLISRSGISRFLHKAIQAHLVLGCSELAYAVAYYDLPLSPEPPQQIDIPNEKLAEFETQGQLVIRHHLGKAACSLQRYQGFIQRQAQSTHYDLVLNRAWQAHARIGQRIHQGITDQLQAIANELVPTEDTSLNNPAPKKLAQPESNLQLISTQQPALLDITPHKRSMFDHPAF